MRSLLFVPADSERKLEKALSSGADALILDLEDSVALSAKQAARQMAGAFLQAADRTRGPRLLVRINALETGLAADDLSAVMPFAPSGIMLPKAAGGTDVTRLSAILRVHEAENNMQDRATTIIPIASETAASTLNLASYRKSSPRLEALTWGAEDLSADIGASASRDAAGGLTGVFALARSLTLLGAAAADVTAIDTVFVDFRDDEGLRRECMEAERDGFTGKMAIHPSQVPVINDAFTPSREAVADAEAVVRAFAGSQGLGVTSIDGRMLDRPHLRRAERILARASRNI